MRVWFCVSDYDEVTVGKRVWGMSTRIKTHLELDLCNVLIYHQGAKSLKRILIKER